MSRTLSVSDVMKTVRIFLSGLMLFVAAAVLGCGGGSDSSPTAPQQPDYLLQGVLFIQNSNFQSSLQEIEVLLDGRRIGTVTDAGGAVQMVGNLTSVTISPGNHTVALRIVEQTTSRANYWTPGSRVFVTHVPTGNRVLDQTLQTFRASRTEGQGFEWSFQF